MIQDIAIVIMES